MATRKAAIGKWQLQGLMYVRIFLRSSRLAARVKVASGCSWSWEAWAHPGYKCKFRCGFAHTRLGAMRIATRWLKSPATKWLKSHGADV